MSVAVLADHLVTGGAEKHAVALANGLDKERFAVSCFTLKRDGGLECELAHERLEAVGCADVGLKVDLAAIGRLARLIDQSRCEAVIATNAYAALYGRLAASRSLSRPAVLAVFHSTILPGLKNQLQMLFYRMLFPLCDGLVFVSENQRHYWKKRGLWAKHVEVIHNGIDMRHFSKAAFEPARASVRTQWGFPDTSFVVGICAALRPEKAHADLLRAIVALIERGIDARAAIIGDGPERGALERQIATLGLGGRIVITGFQKDTRPFVDACDAMVLTSHGVETFSLSALESMALGKPMVMTDIGGASEQVQAGENGFLYAPGDLHALVDALQRLVSVDERNRIGATAELRVRQRFPVEAMLESYARLLLRFSHRTADGLNSQA